MAGLATRYALSLPASSGLPIRGRVANVVTFGTPNLRSAFATYTDAVGNVATGAGLVAGGAVGSLSAGAWLASYACGRAVTKDADSFPCSVLPAVGCEI